MLRYVSLRENFDKNLYYHNILIITAGQDTLNYSIYNYAIQLRSIGVNVIWTEAPTLIHGLSWGQRRRVAIARSSLKTRNY